MAISDFDFSGGFSPVDNQQFGVATPDFGFNFSPSMQETAYNSGLGVDTAKYGLDQQKKAKGLSFLDIAGLGAGVAGDIIRGTRGQDPVFGPSLLNQKKSKGSMAGDLLGRYFGSPSTNTEDLAPLVAGLFSKYMGDYLKSAGSGQPMI